MNYCLLLLMVHGVQQLSFLQHICISLWKDKKPMSIACEHATSLVQVALNKCSSTTKRALSIILVLQTSFHWECNTQSPRGAAVYKIPEKETIIRYKNTNVSYRKEL
jgi:hypothetical protein